MKRILLYISVFCLTLGVFDAPVLVLAMESGATNTQTMPDLLGNTDFERDGFDEEDWNDDFLQEQETIADPLEPMNRAFFVFNDKLYDWMLKPVSKGYSWVIPLDLRNGFGNFFANIAAPVRLVNSLLQGNIRKSWIVLQRFSINSTAGMFGLNDVANTEFGLSPQKADFGQTLGKWGLGFGPYIYWPFLGPSSLRDTVGLGVDWTIAPVHYFCDEWEVKVSLSSTEKINKLSLNPNVYDDLRRLTLDPYIAARQAYCDYRRKLTGQKKRSNSGE